MRFLISILFFLFLFYLLFRNLKKTEQRKSLIIFTAFYLVAVAVAFSKNAGLSFLETGDMMSALVGQIKAVL